MNDGPANSPSPRRDFLFASVVIGAVFIAMAAQTWRKWADLMEDFGMQLYLPWKISTGSVLYRDVAYIVGGPLSQYYHAALFKIFGVSLMTVAFSNLVLTAVLLLVVYRCFYRASDQLTAITACLAIVTVFAFAHQSTMGIFNYIAPYCAEIVHGLILSVGAVALLEQWFRKEKLWLAALIGFCGGLVFLTKPEIFTALSLTAGAAIALARFVKKNKRFVLQSMGFMAALGVVPPALFFLYFWRLMSGGDAWRAVCGSWVPALTTSASTNPYYRWCMGLDTPAAHLRQMLVQSAGLAVVVAGLALICRRAPRSVVVLAGAGLAALAWKFNWLDCGACLPIVCLALLALQLWRAKVSGLEARAVFPILWTVFSIGMLLKLGLFSRIWHYGFVLAMPAFLGGIYLLLWLLPRELERFRAPPVFLRGLVWICLMSGMAQLTWHSLAFYARKTLPVGTGADKFWVFDVSVRPDDTGMVMALRWLDAHAPPHATLAALPANMMLNYLSRRTNPSRYDVWLPPEIAAFGQQKMLEAFIEKSPDYVILFGMDFWVYGEEYFGVKKQFGGDLMSWIKAHYAEDGLIGSDWLKTGYFGVKIFHKIPTGRGG